MAFSRALVFLCLALLSGCDQQGDQAAAGQQSDLEAQIAQGRKLFISNGCYLCHGEDGRGDGQLGRSLNPRPRDFAELSAYKRGPGLEQLEETIQKGIGTGQGIMPAYPHIPPADRRRIALFIQSLQSKP